MKANGTRHKNGLCPLGGLTVPGPKKSGVAGARCGRQVAPGSRPALRRGGGWAQGRSRPRAPRAGFEEGTLGQARLGSDGRRRPGKVPAVDGLFGPLHSPTLQTGRLRRGRRSNRGPAASREPRGSRARGPPFPTLSAPSQAATPTPLPPAPGAPSLPTSPSPGVPVSSRP